jgi:coenzyme PQQ precursor peptide PqqA
MNIHMILSIKMCNILHTSHIACILIKENTMWTTPAATEMRFGFEITMYVMNK